MSASGVLQGPGRIDIRPLLAPELLIRQSIPRTTTTVQRSTAAPMPAPPAAPADPAPSTAPAPPAVRLNIDYAVNSKMIEIPSARSNPVLPFAVVSQVWQARQPGLCDLTPNRHRRHPLRHQIRLQGHRRQQRHHQRPGPPSPRASPPHRPEEGKPDPPS